MNTKQVLGSSLDYSVQQEVLRAFVHRFTGSHRPQWANKPRADGSAYPVQFADDADWLAHTRFWVRSDGRLDRRVKSCESSPTWPHNPELRLTAEQRADIRAAYANA